MKDKDEFLKYSGRVWNYNLTLIESYKPLLSHKDRAILLDLSLKIQAYDFGIRMQARTDFKEDVFQSYVGEGYIDDEKEVTTKVKNSFHSSFENERSEKIRSLVLETELMHTPSEIEPLEPKRSENLPLRREITLNDDLEEAFLPVSFGSSRRKISKSIKVEFQLSDDMISRIQNLAFDEVVILANRKSSGYVSNNIKKIIDFLEQSIEIYFPIFLKDLGFADKIIPLYILRRNTKEKFNTVCYRCGRRLLKKDSSHYCTRSNNIRNKTIRKKSRACYNANFKDMRDSEFPSSILRTKNKCDNCGKSSSLNYTSKHKGKQMQFCSSKCGETFRKREYRKKKKNII